MRFFWPVLAWAINVLPDGWAAIATVGIPIAPIINSTKPNRTFVAFRNIFIPSHSDRLNKLIEINRIKIVRTTVNAYSAIHPTYAIAFTKFT